MCYAGPVAGALISSLVWNRTKSVKVWWLMLLYFGGALFGVIDHLWNKELFFISGDSVKDLLLGVVITLSIFIAWAIAVLLSKTNPTLARYLSIEKR
jgi:energy-coupling factor transporter transmembrane protein EcfT